MKTERRKTQVQSTDFEVEDQEPELLVSEAGEDQYLQQASEDEETADENELPVHESLSKSNRNKGTRGKKVKYVPDGETAEMRDTRTIFIGNLPVDIITSKVSPCPKSWIMEGY